MNAQTEQHQPHDLPAVDPERLDQELVRGEDVLILDVRPADDYECWNVDPGDPRVLNVPLPDLGDSIDEIRKRAQGRDLRVICAAGISSIGATETLIAAGLTAENVTGGMIAWSRILKAAPVPGVGEHTVIQFRREARGCLSYLAISGDEALVVDPAPEIGPYLEEAERRGVRIVAVFDTHIHADHISGARAFLSDPGVTYFLGSPAAVRGLIPPQGRYRLVGDGDPIPFGDAGGTVVTLPGHTTEMSGLAFGEFLFCGDSVFADGLARPDLQDGSPEAARDAARQLYRTITEKLRAMPLETIVLTCHYPGGRLSGPLAPTLGEVFESVPQLSWEEEPFVEWLVAELPSKPSSFERIIEANLGLLEAPALDLGRLETGANSCASR